MQCRNEYAKLKLYTGIKVASILLHKINFNLVSEERSTNYTDIVITFDNYLYLQCEIKVFDFTVNDRRRFGVKEKSQS